MAVTCDEGTADKNYEPTCLTNILLLIARCFPGAIRHSFLSLFSLFSVLGTYTWATGCLRIRVLTSSRVVILCL